ncbi:MAG: M3 family metallopeptidase, partial [Actinomycetota bacterium]
ETKVRDAELSGVGLVGEQRERFKQIETESAELATRFTNNLLDSTKAFTLDLTSEEDVEGLPLTWKGAAAQMAAGAGLTRDGEPPSPEAGPWRLTLDAPMYVPFLQHSRRQDLREQVYRATISRASEGETDNVPIMKQMLELRKETAVLLGYLSFAEVSLAEKMAGTVGAVNQLMTQIQDAALPKSRQELDGLEEFAGTKLELWDTAFWAERQREQLFDYTDEQLRPYFPLPRVLDGLFDIAQELFGVTINPSDGETPVWDPSVRFFRVTDDTGAEIAAFYLDPYSRSSNKRSGAWMNVCLSRKRMPDGSIRLPVAYLCCNQSPPVGDVPSLMSFTEVFTLFHEFGHGLQHMLTTVDHPQAAGIANVEWDAVEVPSTFMQQWCYDHDTLIGVTKHHETGAALPEELFDKINGARTFMSGTAICRQIYFSEIDMQLHDTFDPSGNESIFERQHKVARDSLVMQPLPEDRFLCSFSHIFSGSYSAGYYSYIWAAVLAADAFEAFTEGQGSRSDVGRRFRETILSLGGGRHPMDVFKDFRGRPPSTEPLMRMLGLK